MDLLRNAQVLICQPFFMKYSGSEIITLELSEALAQRGADVTIATWLYSPQMAAEVAALPRVTLLQIGTDEYEHYASRVTPALIWVHQGLVPEEFMNCASRFVFAHLSSFNSFEFSFNPDIESALADRVYFVSAEAHQEQKKTGILTGIGQEKIRLLENPAPIAFHHIAPKLYEADEPQLTSLLVVSNHLPASEVEAIALLRSRGITVEVVGTPQLGVDASPRRVDPNLVSEFDAVMTIGKTVQYGMCAGRPVFCYDYFGGPGWLSKDNIATAKFHNFSGRGFEERTARELVEELTSGFPAAYKQCLSMLERAREEFSYERVLDDLRVLLASPLGREKVTDSGTTVGYVKAHQTVRDFGTGYYNAEHQLSVPDEQLNRLVHEVQLKQTHIVNLEAIIQSLQQDVQRLDHESANEREGRMALASDLDSVTNTISWKITAPLRAVRRSLGRWKQRYCEWRR